MDDEKYKPPGTEVKPVKRSMFPKVSEVGIFDVRPNDLLVVKIFKYIVNYTMFGFVMFMTALVWLITILVV